MESWWGGRARRCECQRTDAAFYGTITYLQSYSVIRAAIAFCNDTSHLPERSHQTWLACRASSTQSSVQARTPGLHSIHHTDHCVYCATSSTSGALFITPTAVPTAFHRRVSYSHRTLLTVRCHLGGAISGIVGCTIH